MFKNNQNHTSAPGSIWPEPYGPWIFSRKILSKKNPKFQNVKTSEREKNNKKCEFFKITSEYVKNIYKNDFNLRKTQTNDVYM